MATQKILRMPVKLDATGITGNTSSAILEINSTNKGFLPPRMTYVQMTGITGVTAGLQLYQTDTVIGNKLHDGTYFRHLNDSEGLHIKTGTDKTAGLITLTGGTATVSTTKVTSTSLIFLTRQNNSGTVTGSVDITARVASTSFTITSNNALDTSDVAWLIVEPYIY